MKKTALRPRPSLMLLWLGCAMALSSCGTTSRLAIPPSCPEPSPAPSNVMRAPNYEQRSRQTLFESAVTPMTKSEPSKPSSPPTVPR